MDLDRLEDVLVCRGEPSYRADQVWDWAARGAKSYGEMTNVSADLRAELEESVPYSTLELAEGRGARTAR